MDEADPLGVFLVKQGSKAGSLLFRYPFHTVTTSEPLDRKEQKNIHVLSKEKKDELSTPRKVKRNDSEKYSLLSFDDEVLSNFAVKQKICGQKFELKLENVRFVGHPAYLPQASNREKSTLTMFHIVFAMKAEASHSIVNCYYDLSRRLSIAIHHDELRCRYLTSQVKLMQIAHDEVAALPEDSEESPFSLILSRSQLAMDLKTLYEDLKTSGTVHLKINNWIEVSFCIPNKVHHLHDERLAISPDVIQKSLNALRPYHGVLFLVDSSELLSCLPEDALPALVRLIRVSSPLKNLQQIAADADIILSNVFQLVGHLVYWAKATVIYPLCDSNVYVVSPSAPTHIHSTLTNMFAERFSGMNLLPVLSQFSLPTSLSNLASPMNLPYQQAQQVQMVIWMLQHRLLMQLHTYVFLIPSDHSHQNACGGRNREDQQRREADSANYGSYHSEGSFTSQNPSGEISKSDSEEDLSLREQDYLRLADLTPAERNSILKDSAANNSNDDIKNFLRLCPYFKGRHHLEEIMYCENIRRSQLLALLDKFRKNLITYQYEDAAVSAFYNYT